MQSAAFRETGCDLICIVLAMEVQGVTSRSRGTRGIAVVRARHGGGSDQSKSSETREKLLDLESVLSY